MTDLGALPGYPYTVAYGINNVGQVVGEATFVPVFSDSTCRAFLYSGGSMSDLGTLGGDFSLACGINANGQVVGRASTTSGNDHAFLWAGGMLNDLGTLPGGTASGAWGINSAGEIVGWADTGGGYLHAFLYSGQSMTDLNALIDPSLGWTLMAATAINDSGQIVGYGSDGGYVRAFLMTPVPEPATPLLFTLGAFTLAGWAWHRWRRRG